jgi:hypothetical protein
MINPYVAHPYVATAVTMMVANCFITAMPTPTEKSSAFYVWLFRGLHAMLLSLSRIVASLPDSAAKKAIEAAQEPPKP